MCDHVRLEAPEFPYHNHSQEADQVCLHKGLETGVAAQRTPAKLPVSASELSA